MRPQVGTFQVGTFSEHDHALMKQALAFARRGAGYVAPNPQVGAVVAKDGKMIGWGWHEQYGAPHAEVRALEVAGEAAKGATLYVTLEPCNHYGLTPPCVDAIVKAGISRVIAAMRDPNLHLPAAAGATKAGGGLAALAQVGIDCQLGLELDTAAELNRGWIHWVRTNKPYIVLKLAVSLDGKICTASGDSRWISSEASRRQVQRLRRSSDAILVGVKTILQDDPALTNRSGRGRQPLRVILDSDLRIPLEAKVLSDQGAARLVVTTSRGELARRKELEKLGVEVLVLEDKSGKVELSSLFEVLGARKVQSVLCEGGGELASRLIENSHFHRLILFTAPMLLGRSAKEYYQAPGVDIVAQASRFHLKRVKRIGHDVLSVYDREDDRDLLRSLIA